MSRPKRRVLLIDADEDRRGALAFVLRTVGMVVAQAARPGDARGESCDILVGVWPLSPAGLMARADLERRRAGVPLLLLGEALKACPDGVEPDATLLGPVATVEILERIRLLCRRRRGPRKGVVRHARAVSAAGSGACYGAA